MNSISVHVEFGNVGQILACYGLLEAADRLWRSQAWVTGRFEFELSTFVIDAPGSVRNIIDWLKYAEVKNVSRIEKPAKRCQTSAPQIMLDYKGEGDDPAIMQFNDSTEWVLDNWSAIADGRPKIKTFAGQIKAPKVIAYLIECLKRIDVFSSDTLFDIAPAHSGAAVFGFDGRKGKSALDIGFSPDAINMNTEIFPAVELFAAIGLQHIRPAQDGKELELGLWPQRLPVELARAVASLGLKIPGIRRRRFRLVGRKKRSGVSNAQNDQYQTFTYANEVI